MNQSCHKHTHVSDPSGNCSSHRPKSFDAQPENAIHLSVQKSQTQGQMQEFLEHANPD